MGGPDGGHGGRGGDVWLRSDPHLSTLMDLTYRPHFAAQDGLGGQGSNKAGRSGEDLVIRVPCATVVFRERHFLADLLEPEQQMLVAKGGRGGRGNASFKTSRRTAPRLAERGEPGEAFTLDLELKLIADVGLIGCPNAGKSTLLARLTSARPKIADYPFTTTTPLLGVARVGNAPLVVADIPGLIEGAHQGKGLGHDFLRHIERTRVLVHLVDVLGYQGHTAADNVRQIQAELAAYSPVLLKKPRLMVANKMDLTGAPESLAALQHALGDQSLLAISAATGHGLKELLRRLVRLVQTAPTASVEGAPPRQVHYRLQPDFTITQEGPRFKVSGPKVERLVAMTNFDLEEGVQRLQGILKKMGVETELRRCGASPGATVKIGPHEFTFEP